MQLEQAIELATTLMADYDDLFNWSLQLNDRPMRRLGLCIYSRRVIQLSTRFVQLNDEAAVVETTLHEIAHALVGPGQGHGKVWKEMALIVGCKPISCKRDAIMPPGPWIATCPTCARTFWMYRTPRKLRRWCKACGREAGILTFVPNPEF